MSYWWLLLAIPACVVGRLAWLWVKVGRTLREIDETERRRVEENARKRRAQ